MSVIKSKPDAWFSYHNEVNIGVLYKKEDAYTDINNKHFESSDACELLLSINNGFVYHISKHINLDMTLKFQYTTDKIFHSGVGLGVVYLF